MEVNNLNAATDKNLRPHNASVIVGLVALGFILLTLLILFGNEVLLSLKEYNVFKGVSGSPWVGLKNYQDLFANVYTGRIIINTLVFNLLFAGFCFCISSVGGLAVNAFSQKSVLRDALAVLAILPVFVSNEAYAAWFINLLGSHPFVNSGTIRFLLPIIVALKYAGIPIFVTHILGVLNKMKDTALPIKCAGLFSLASLSLAGLGNFSLVNQLINPAVYETTDIIDTYSYRIGLMQMQYKVNAAVGVLQVVICLVSMAILFVPVKKLYKAAFQGEKEYERHSVPRCFAGAAIGLAVFVLLYLLPSIVNGSLLAKLPAGVALYIPIDKILFWTVISMVPALLCTGIAFAASSFADGAKAVRTGGAVLLAVITILTARQFTISGYMTIRSMGMVNTYMAIVMASMFSATAVWAFAAMRGDVYMRSSRMLLFGAVAVFLIQTALIYIDGMPSLLYLSRPQMSPLLMYRQILISIQGISDYVSRKAFYSMYSVSGLILSLPAILSFVLAKSLLPAETMIAVISGGRKH